MFYISHHLMFLITYAVPDGQSEKTEFEVFKFKGAGGVALSMYNTDEVLMIFFTLFLVVHLFFFSSLLFC